MTKKVILTGGLVIIAKGSSAQILLGQIVCVLYLILCIRTLPYADDTDDLLQSLASTCLLLNMMIAFALKTNNEDDPEYDEYTWGILLIMINMIVMILGCTGMLVLGCPCILQNCKKLGCLHGQLRKRMSKKGSPKIQREVAANSKRNIDGDSEKDELKEENTKKHKKYKKKTKVAPRGKSKARRKVKQASDSVESRGSKGRGAVRRQRGGRTARGRAALRGRSSTTRGGRVNRKKRVGLTSMGGNGWGGTAAKRRPKTKKVRSSKTTR